MSAFLAAGLPAFGLAIAVNFVLVVWLGVPKILAYLPALFAQTFANFLMCRYVLFAAESLGQRFWRQYLHFLSGSLVFRGLDWALYAAWTSLGMYFVAAQVLNVVVFSIARFRFAEWLFNRGKTALRGGSAAKAPAD